MFNKHALELLRSITPSKKFLESEQAHKAVKKGFDYALGKIK